MVKFVYFYLFANLFLFSCTRKKIIRNEEIPYNTILIDSVNYEIDFGLMVKDTNGILFKEILDGSSLCRHKIISKQLEELELDSFQDLKYLSIYEPSDDQTFREYKDLFLKELKLYYLDTYIQDGLQLHLILQEYPGKRDSILKHSYMIFTNKGKTYCISTGVCSCERMESDFESGTLYQKSTFEYRYFISENDTIFQRYNISKYGLTLFKSKLSSNEKKLISDEQNK